MVVALSTTPGLFVSKERGSIFVCLVMWQLLFHLARVRLTRILIHKTKEKRPLRLAPWTPPYYPRPLHVYLPATKYHLLLLPCWLFILCWSRCMWLPTKNVKAHGSHYTCDHPFFLCVWDDAKKGPCAKHSITIFTHLSPCWCCGWLLLQKYSWLLGGSLSRL